MSLWFYIRESMLEYEKPYQSYIHTIYRTVPYMFVYKVTLLMLHCWVDNTNLERKKKKKKTR